MLLGNVRQVKQVFTLCFYICRAEIKKKNVTARAAVMQL